MIRLIFILSVIFPVCSYAQTLTRGPYLQSANQTSITIRWRTDIPTKSKITLGTTQGIYPIVTTDNSSVTEHTIKVGGLQSDTRYYYTIETDAIKLQGDANNFFTTAPSDTTTRKMSFAVFGDCGRDEKEFRTNSLLQYRNYLQSNDKQASDLMLLLGDNAYDNCVDTEYRDEFFAAYQSNILKNHVLFPALGNHEYANDINRQKDHNIDYFNIFSVPDNGECGGVPSHSKAYYSYDWGNIHFMSFDSYGIEDAGTTRMYDTNGKQAQWVKADLAANTKKWTVAYWHHPPYTMGTHNSDAETELAKIRQNFIQILEHNGVDMILCGHSHVYERSYLLKGYYANETLFNKAIHTSDSSSAMYDGSINSCPYIYKSGKENHGTVYVVSGSAGASGTVTSSFPHNATPFAFNDGGMFYFDVQENRLDAKFIRQDGVIADKFTIIKDAGRRDTIMASTDITILHASWIGKYYWSTGNFGRDVHVGSTTTATYTVKDDKTNTCLTDTITVLVDEGTRVYPNPAKNILYVELSPAKSSDYSFAVYNMAGKLLYEQANSLHMGWQRVSIPLDGIATGQFLLIIDNKEQTETIRFVKN